MCADTLQSPCDARNEIVKVQSQSLPTPRLAALCSRDDQTTGSHQARPPCALAPDSGECSATAPADLHPRPRARGSCASQTNVLSVLNRIENILPMIPTQRHVIQRTGSMQTQRSRHLASDDHEMNSDHRNCNILQPWTTLSSDRKFSRFPGPAPKGNQSSSFTIKQTNDRGDNSHESDRSDE